MVNYSLSDKSNTFSKIFSI